MLGHTCTVFHTIDGSRHEIEGLYLDTILNENREENFGGIRKERWLAWMEFLNELKDICLATPEDAIFAQEHPANRRQQQNKNSPLAARGSNLSNLPDASQAIDIDLLKPMIDFLNDWLSDMKDNEKGYNYYCPKNR